MSKEEITLLPESQRVVNFDLPKTVRLPPILPMLLMPPICNHVFLRDTKGDVMGRKGDFRVNWPVNRRGMPVDLAKQLNKTVRDDNDDNTGKFTEKSIVPNAARVSSIEESASRMGDEA